MNSTTIQTIAAAIQAFASIVFCGSVIFEARMRARLQNNSAEISFSISLPTFGLLTAA